MTDFVRLTPKEAYSYWGLLEPFILRGIENSNGERSIENYLSDILANKLFIWVVINENEIEGVGITGIIQNPAYLSLHVYLVAGNNKDIIITQEILDKWEEHAKLFKCKNITMWGRKGWSRVLDKLGWKEDYIVMSKDLKED